MAGRIPRTFIEDLLSRLDLIEVIDARVPLKKTGANYSACCPFHNEKTPSFSVNPSKQFYYCFGCGASGDAIKFLMEYERLDFSDAIEQLANKAGMEVPRQELTPQQKKAEITRKTVYDLLNDTARFYFENLRKENTPRNYLVKRELSPKVAHRFGLGFALGEWDALLKRFDSHNDFTQEMLIEAGLLIDNEESNRRYDRFRNRIMFPIRDVRGRVIGFGGRVLDDSKPKYLNSPETAVFHKGRELYGLFETKQQHKDIKRLLVVEGYMDVVALAQFDIDYAVATLGTAATPEHIDLAFKNTSEIVFCFDGDAAGRKAAVRALNNALPKIEDGRSIRFLFLPEGEDPDTLVRRIGKEQFEKLVDHAAPIEEFIFQHAGQDIDVSAMDGRAKLAKLVAAQIELLPEGVFKELMHEELAKRTGLNRSTIDKVLHTPSPEPAQEHYDYPYESSEVPPDYDGAPANYIELPKLAKLSKRAQSVELNTRIIGLLVRQPSNIDLFSDMPELPESSSTLQLIELLEFIKKHPEYTQPQIYGHWVGLHGTEAAQSLGECVKSCQPIPDNGIREELQNYLKFYRKNFANQHRKSRLEELKAKPLASLTDEEREEYRVLLKKRFQ